MRRTPEEPRLVKKLLGADFELSNTFMLDGGGPDVDEAVKRLLDEVPGYPQRATAGTAIERGRRFLSSTGASAYEDSGHFEWNTPEHASALEHPHHVHAGLRVAQKARQLAEAHAPHGAKLHVIANNCDGLVSYGSHLNLLTTQSCLADLCGHKPHLACFLATHLVTSVLYTGQGMVGAANGRNACSYQLSQRADWFEQLWSEGTMQKRPLINQRNEPHAWADLARLHCIYYDMVLAPTANRLRTGTLQAVVALCEAGAVDPTVILEDPVAAASDISRDLSVNQPLPTIVRGRRMSATRNTAGHLEPGRRVPWARDIGGHRSRPGSDPGRLEEGGRPVAGARRRRACAALRQLDEVLFARALPRPARDRLELRPDESARHAVRQPRPPARSVLSNGPRRPGGRHARRGGIGSFRARAAHRYAGLFAGSRTAPFWRRGFRYGLVVDHLLRARPARVVVRGAAADARSATVRSSGLCRGASPGHVAGGFAGSLAGGRRVCEPRQRAGRAPRLALGFRPTTFLAFESLLRKHRLPNDTINKGFGTMERERQHEYHNPSSGSGATSIPTRMPVASDCGACRRGPTG